MRKLTLAALALVVIVAASRLAGVGAQPTPPNRFYGTLTIDGQPAPAGTLVRGFIGGVDCTTPREPFMVPAGSYAVEVAHGSQIAGCGTEGAEVTFRVGARVANERGTFRVGQFTQLNLTISGVAPPPPPPPPPPTSTQATTARLDLNPDTARCIPEPGLSQCDEFRQRLWTGDAAAWTEELAQQGEPPPTPDEIFVLTYEFRIGANDPAAITSLARGLGWPKIYITAVRFRGSTPDEADEYIEITNVGGAPQDMTGWRAYAVESSTDFFFSEGSVLEPRAVCRFYTNVTRPDSCPGSINVSPSGVWNDAGGSAELWYDPLELLADRTLYSADPNNQPPPPNLRLVMPVG